MAEKLTQISTQKARSEILVHNDERIDLLGSLPFLSMHAACLLVLCSGISWVAVAACAALAFVRMFGVTAGYHRYFSHRAYKTSRFFQFLLALLGTSALQKGPLWWAAHHRHHHRYSDTELDIHSPITKGFWWSHVGWILCSKYNATNMKAVPDLAKFPELRFLNRYHIIAPIALAVSLFGLGTWLNHSAPQLHTSGLQMLSWGFFVSTILAYHITYLVNSLTHIVGRRRFVTKDESRNSLVIALLTLGEGWHNNHHRYPSSERQGFYWWEIDVSHYILKLLSWMRIVWDLREPPKEIYAQAERTKKWIKAACA
ncbi:MAG: acyl-CoA desaturase [Acidobacteria bacterium]|nr:acyl-CoA desaturase [Acidobacteriota bacterium]